MERIDKVEESNLFDQFKSVIEQENQSLFDELLEMIYYAGYDECEEKHNY